MLELLSIIIIAPNRWYDQLAHDGKSAMRFLVFCMILPPLVILTSVASWPINFIALNMLGVIGLWRLLYLIIMRTL